MHKSFDGQRVLAGLDLCFARGATTVIVGPSGTGKSVLLKHIAGLERPDRGEVWFEQDRIDRLGDAALMRARMRMGFLFQMSALFDSMDVAANVAFPLHEHTRMTEAQRAERCRTVLGLVGLSDIERKMPSELSGGMRKRVALARAIVMEPKLVLYDEPTTGLDPIRADVINELIVVLSQKLGISSIVVTHDMASAEKIADRMLMLHEGGIIADGDQRTFLRCEEPLVRQFVEGRAGDDELRGIRGVTVGDR